MDGRFVNPTDYPTAWGHPLTRRAWVQHMAMNVAGLVGWIVAWFGQLYVLIVFLSRGFIFVFALTLLYAFYRAIIQLRYFPTAFHIRRVLQEYPWQMLYNVPRGIDEHPDAEDSSIWIELPDPTGRSEKGVPLTFVKHHRVSWWLRHIGGPRTKPERKAQLEPLWFAGDPRFLGVVAVSTRNGRAPRRLHFLYRPSAFDRGAVGRQWESVDAADLERARRAGARFTGATAAPH